MTAPRAWSIPLRLLVLLWAAGVGTGLAALHALYGPAGGGSSWASSLFEHRFELLIVAIGLGTMALLLDHCLLRPLRELHRAFDRVSRGESPPALPRSRVREVDEIVRGFAATTATLADTLESLSQSEARFRAMTESAPDAILTVGADGRIDQFNRAAERLFGYSAAEARGQPLSLLLEPGKTTVHTQVFASFVAQGDATSRRMDGGRLVRGMRRDGRTLSLEIGISTARVRDEHVFTAMIRDVSDRVLAETELGEYRRRLESLVQARTAELATERDRAQAATRSKNEFLANMSHELRTPMNAILGLTHLGLRQATGEHAQHLQRIETSATQLMDALNDILEFSRLENGPLDLCERDTDLARTLAQVARMLGESATQKGLQLVTWVDADVPPVVAVDELRLRQVLLNLCGNAIKFTERGHVTMHVRVMGHSGAQPRLRFEVNDSGIGMSAQTLERLGSAFEQADTSATRAFGGLGLGLAICRRVLQMMGSTLDVSSQPGRGSTFWFDLSVGLAADPSPPAAAPGGDETLHVLVVDELADARHAMTAQLARLGYPATATTPGAATRSALADACAEGSPIALIVSSAAAAWADEGPDTPVTDHPFDKQAAVHAQDPPGYLWVQALAPTATGSAVTRTSITAQRRLTLPADPGELANALADTARAHNNSAAYPNPQVSEPEQGLEQQHAQPIETANGLADRPRGFEAQLKSHWLRIAGLRADIAMRRLRGDPMAYGRLLASFVQTHRDDVQHLRALIAGAQPREAFELAHALKSSAAAVGALELAAAATAIPPSTQGLPAAEQAARRVEALADTLEAALCCIDTALADAPQPPAPALAQAAASRATSPPDEELRQELLRKLERRDMSSLRFARLHEADILRMDADKGPAALQAILAFDYDRALALLGGLPQDGADGDTTTNATTTTTATAATITSGSPSAGPVSAAAATAWSAQPEAAV